MEKYLFVENKFRDSFRRWGFREVRTSTVDYFDIIRGGAGEGFADSIFKVQDCDGRLLSVRGELTTQIARMLASKARDEGRLFYIANCIRFLEEKTLSRREFWQAGAELIGGVEVEADAEVIALVLSSLEALGIGDASIDVGNVGLFMAAARAFNITDYEALRRVLASRSMEDLKVLTMDTAARETFSFLMERRGGPGIVKELAEMVKERSDAIGKFAGYFEELFQLLDSYGFADKVKIDLTTLREKKYYNGTVFEIFVDGLGVPIGGGGRYDSMMKEFELKDIRATGFALSVDLCVKALDLKAPGAVTPGIITRVLYEEGYLPKAIGLAARLRRRGIVCSLDRFSGEQEGVLVGETTTELGSGKAYREGGE